MWRPIQLALLAIIPALMLLALFEGAFRLLGLGKPSLSTRALPEEQAGLLQFDRGLFWTLRPGLRITYRGASVTVNRFGVRGSDIADKTTNEFRILSLGESTTFGLNVSDADPYSVCLGEMLNQEIHSEHFTVVNAGVPAYSSSQSLKYLEQHGLKFKPDLILFYHEVNDYLPSSLRDSSQNEIGLALTDKQLYESRIQKAKSFLTRHSALFRFLSFRDASRRIRKLNTNDLANPLSMIGLDGIGIHPRVFLGTNDIPRPVVNERALGRRVSDAERRQNLQQLSNLCRRLGIGLVIIHPSYRDSVPHECLLTEFCREEKVLMFDAFSSLHPPHAGESLFTDAWHPTAEGHRILAENLAAFITEHFFKPDTRQAVHNSP